MISVKHIYYHITTLLDVFFLFPDSYKMLQSDTQSFSLKLVDNMAPAFATDGLDVKFYDGTTPLTTATAGSTSGITDKNSAFSIQLASATADAGVCLTHTPEYVTTGCTGTWYFIVGE